MSRSPSERQVRENRRRAEILARYVSIQRPTRDDDQRFAAELGLSDDSLIRLAKIWRRYGDERLLGRSAAPIGPDHAPHALVQAKSPDLNGVPKKMRAETLRRIRVIQAHLSASARGDGDLVASAAELGLSVERFRTLARVWQAHADPSALPGSGARQAPIRRRNPSRARMLSILEGIVAVEGPNAKVTRIDQLYREACATAGLEPLSLSRVYALVQRIRRDAPQAICSSE